MRQPKPFFRNFTKTWYVTLGGTQINLGADKDEAWQEYHELGRGSRRARIAGKRGTSKHWLRPRRRR